MKKALLLLMLLPALALFGCGGGGGGDVAGTPGGGYTDGISDSGGVDTSAANVGTFPLYALDESGTNSALLDFGNPITYSTGVRTVVRKYTTTYPNIIINVCSDEVPALCSTTTGDFPTSAADPRCTECLTLGTECLENPYYTAPQTTDVVCSWNVPEFCDVNDPPSPTDWRCTGCTGPEVPGTCETNPFYGLQLDPESYCINVTSGTAPECVNVDTGVEDTSRPSNTLTYKKVEDTMLNATGGGTVTIGIPASQAADDLYIVDAVRYVAGDLLLVDAQNDAIAHTPLTSCAIIGEVDTVSGLTCGFFPLDVTGVTLEEMVDADLHIARDYWQGQDNNGTPTDDTDDLTELFINSGDNNPNLAAVLADPVVLSLPDGDVWSGLNYTVANIRLPNSDVLRNNWSVRQEINTDLTRDAVVFVSGGADTGISAGTGDLTLTAPETFDVADDVLYHFGHFYLSPGMLISGESYLDWTYVTNYAGVLNPMGSLPIP
ncbi:hypothetical protein ACFLZ5_00730 [Thermodesulfobacteriota bacterium]